MVTVRLTPRQWLAAAGWIALGWVVAAVVTAGLSLTVGIVTGLIVLTVPAFLLASWLCLVAVVVCLAQWRGHRALARVLAASLALVPAALAVGAYVNARRSCSSDPDPAGCLAYLDGSPLLVALVVATVLVGLLALAAAWWATAEAAPAAGGDPPS